MKLDKLRRKYGYTGASYQELISKILYENASNINNHVISLDDAYYKDVAKRFNKKSIKRFVVPDISNEMYDNAIQIRKSAEKGKLISDTLKDQLRENLREIFDIKTDKTGQSKVIVQTGKKAGIINQSMIDLYEEKITETFANYLKDNEKIPANIKTIATTEVRSAVHDIQHHYVGELVRRNPSLKIMKKWIHNPNLSKMKPRDNHAELGRLKPIPYNENWIFISQSGKIVSASRPHDPSLPPEEVIGCHCDIEYQGVYTMDKSKELNEVRKTLINMNIVAKGRKGYDIGTIVDRKDGKWKKTGEGQWEKVRDEEQSLEGDDKELDAMIDEKGKMSEEMQKPDIDEMADIAVQMIEEGTITQEDLDKMTPEELYQLASEEGFINEGDPEADERMDKINDLIENHGYTKSEAQAEVDGVNIDYNEDGNIKMSQEDFDSMDESDKRELLQDSFPDLEFDDLSEQELDEYFDIQDENDIDKFKDLFFEDKNYNEYELEDVLKDNEDFINYLKDTEGFEAEEIQDYIDNLTNEQKIDLINQYNPQYIKYKLSEMMEADDEPINVHPNDLTDDDELKQDIVNTLIQSGYISSGDEHGMSNSELAKLYNKVANDKGSDALGGSDDLGGQDKWKKEGDRDISQSVKSSDDEDKFLESKKKEIQKDLIKMYKEDGLSTKEAKEIVNEMSNQILWEMIGGTEGLEAYGYKKKR